MKGRDTVRESVRDWITDVMGRTGLSAGKLARRAGVAASTIHRALDPTGTFIMTVTTLTKISQELGIPLPPGLLAGQPQSPYLSNGFAESELEALDGAPQAEGKAAVNQGVWRISSRALELEGYLPGDVVIVDMGVKPSPGDIVCAQIYNFARGTAETVLRLYEPPYLIGRAIERGMQPKPALIDGERVVVVGTVVRMIRERHAA